MSAYITIDQLVQFSAWFLALVEFILALYVFLLNWRHTANQHVAALLFLFAVNNLGFGMFVGATTVAEAQLASYIQSATSVAMAPALLIVSVVLLKPEWLRGRWRWVWWPVYGLAFLPALLTVIDVLAGTTLWYTGLDPATYAGGFISRSDYTLGSLSMPLRVLDVYLMGLAPLFLILYVLIFDRKVSPMTRRLAWLLLFTQGSTLVIQFGLRSALGIVGSTFAVSIVLVIGYAYAAFAQMISERRAQRGRLQTRLMALVLAATIPLLIAVVAFVTVQASDVVEEQANEHLASTNRALTASVETWTRLNVQALQQLVTLPDMIAMDAGRQRPILKAMAAAHPHMYLVSTTDLNGLNVARSDDAEPKDYRDRLWFQEPRYGAPLAFQSLVGRTSGQPALAVSMPIRDQAGGTVGVGMFAANLDDIALDVEASRVGDTGFAYVVDAQNQVIAHPDPPFSSELRDLGDYPPVAALRQGTQGFVNFADEEGTWRAYVSELDNGWGVIVQQPEAELLLPLIRLQWVAAAVIVLGTLMLLVLAWLTMSQALRPVDSLTATATAITAGDLERVAPVESEDEFGTLARTFNVMTAQLRELIGSLEQQVADRTRDLEQRSAYLEATADVGSAASSILDMDQLVQQVVELIRERFDLYYVGLFQVDASAVGTGTGEEWAVLRAGTGEAGRIMLERGHRIQVGEGMVGWSVARGQSRVAVLAGEDAVRLATPELPETRSEAALPLRSRGQVLGALSVQHTETGAFDEDTMAVLQTMADQVAVALDNARLFTESQEALETARRVYGEVSRQAWRETLRPRRGGGYRYVQQALSTADDEWRPEMVQAGRLGRTVRGDGGQADTLSIPIQVRDEVVGVLGFRKGEGERWTDQEVELLESFTLQLESALESARLYQDTQRRAAADRLVGEVTGRIRETLDVDRVLQTAVREMGEALGIPKVEVRLGRAATRLQNGPRRVEEGSDDAGSD